MARRLLVLLVILLWQCRGSSTAAVSYSMVTTCDDLQTVYFDGVQQPAQPYMNLWNKAVQISVPWNTVVIGIKCHNGGGPGGILADFSNGLITDDNWKCDRRYEDGWADPTFDDSGWTAANEIGPYGIRPWRHMVNGMTGTPQWIWTDNTGHRGDRDVYCRIYLGAPSTTTPTTTIAPQPQGLPAAGHWSFWDPWSECSVSCGGGNQTRQRYCTDPPPQNGGADCVGKSTDTRACAEWGCPDCDHACPEGGDLIECSLCQCMGESTSGKVTITGTSLPLADVEVFAVGQEWEPLTKTNPMGQFTVEDVCVTDLMLKFVKAGYFPEQEQYSAAASGSALAVSMTEMKKPTFTVQPVSVAVFAGDLISLHCEATAVPEPTLYEWFKDGSIIEGTTEANSNELNILNAQEEDQGHYKCRATSPAGKTFSKKAKVTVKASGDDTCDETPTVNVVSLPPTCSLVPGGETTVDIGSCATEKCTVRNSDLPSDILVCCGQIATEVIEAQCEDFVYRTRRITKCGCIECPEGEEVTIKGDLYVEGSDEIVQQYLLFRAEGLQSTTYVFVIGGTFNVKDTPSDDVVTFRYEPGTTDGYLGTVVVVHIIQGVLEYHVPIQLTPKPEPVVVDPSQGATIDVGESPTTSPALQITIPPEAIVDGDGNPVQGDVQMFVSFSDPRVEDGLSSAPGEFTYTDEEGETMELQTFGVVGLQAETADGQKAYVTGSVDFDIDVTSLGILEPDEGEPDTSLWTLDPLSGNWKVSGPLTGNTATKRRKRQTGNGASASSKFPPNIPYINIDKPLLKGRQCYVSVFVYTDETMTAGSSGKRVTIYTKDLTGNTYLGWSVGTTDLDGKVCLPLACGLKHVLVMHSHYGPVASNTHHLPNQFWYHNDHNKAHVVFISPLIGDITDGSGPVHRYDMNTCPGSTQQDYHFQFYLTEPLTEPGRLDAVELRPGLPLSWYDTGTPNWPWDNSSYASACMIGVNVVTDRPSDVLLIAQSFKNDEDGDYYGTYTAGLHVLGTLPMYVDPNQNDSQVGVYRACLEVKCPRFILLDDTQPADDDIYKYIKISLVNGNSTYQCILSHIQKTLQDYQGYDDWEIIRNVEYLERSNNSLALNITDPQWQLLASTVGGWNIGFTNTLAPTGRQARSQLLSSQRFCSSDDDYYYDWGWWRGGHSVATFDCATGGDYPLPWKH